MVAAEMAEIETDGRGRWIAIWESIDPDGPLGSDFDIMISIGDVPEASSSSWMDYK